MARIFLILLLFIVSARTLYAGVECFVAPFADLYSDAAGFGLVAGVQDSVRSLFHIDWAGDWLLGFTGNGVMLPVRDFRFYHAGAGLFTAYRFWLSQDAGWSLMPIIEAGGGFDTRLDSVGSIDPGRISFTLLPSLFVELSLNSFIRTSFGLTLKYLASDSYSTVTLAPQIRISFIPGEAAEPSRAETNRITNLSARDLLKTDLEQMTVDSNFNIQMSPEGDGEVRLNISDMLFEMNSYRIRDSLGGMITGVAGIMKRYPKCYIIIEGFTDDIGDPWYNIQLSGRRANAVASAVIQMGIPEDRVFSKGYGKSRPIVPNDSDANRSRNRRVEIRFLFGR